MYMYIYEFMRPENHNIEMNLELIFPTPYSPPPIKIIKPLTFPNMYDNKIPQRSLALHSHTPIAYTYKGVANETEKGL